MMSLLMEYSVVKSYVSVTMAHLEVPSIIFCNVFFLSSWVASFLLSLFMLLVPVCPLSQDNFILFVNLLFFILVSSSWIWSPFA